MTTTTITAGGVSDNLSISNGNDGALVIQAGPTGAKVNALSIDAAGNVALHGSRQLAQIVTYGTGAIATGTTGIPTDNTIPQSTEGDQYMALSITPTNPASTLEIDITWIGASSVTASIIVALFQDSTANALAVGFQTAFSGGYVQNISFKHIMSAGTTSTTTFKVRAGFSGGGTTTFNGAAGVAYLGGAMASRITIKEYLP